MSTSLTMRDVHKSFGTVHALKGVDLEVDAGQVLALVGENGAGKSTLIKILSGAYIADDGDVVVLGEQIEDATPAEMIERGVAVIYQETSLAPQLSVAENIFLGRLPKTNLGFIDWAQANELSRMVLDQLGVHLDPRTRVQDLSVAGQQMVEIAKALSRDAKVIVLDEPSAVLGDEDLEGLFHVIGRLADQGVAIVYISHRLSEVFQIADKVTVLRDGEHVGTAPVDELDTDALIRMMVGRDLTDMYPDHVAEHGPEVLRLESVTRDGVLTDIDLYVRKGEVLGIAGLAGAGRTELLRAIMGADAVDAGTVHYKQKRVQFRHPRAAIRAGLGLLPENRKEQGLFLNLSVRHNITLPTLHKFKQAGLIRPNRERARARELIDTLRIKTPSTETPVTNLSGGNQQKVVFAKWLETESELLLIDEPTRGIDVGAKQEIYRLIAELAEAGVAIVMVSSELPEIIGLADRVAVMHEGRIAGELVAPDITEENIMRLATGHAA